MTIFFFFFFLFPVPHFHRKEKKRRGKPCSFLTNTVASARNNLFIRPSLSFLSLSLSPSFKISRWDDQHQQQQQPIPCIRNSWERRERKEGNYIYINDWGGGARRLLFVVYQRRRRRRRRRRRKHRNAKSKGKGNQINQNRSKGRNGGKKDAHKALLGWIKDLFWLCCVLWWWCGCWVNSQSRNRSQYAIIE